MWLHPTRSLSPGQSHNLLSLGDVQGQCSEKSLQELSRVQFGPGAECLQSIWKLISEQFCVLMDLSDLPRIKTVPSVFNGWQWSYKDDTVVGERSGNLNLVNNT